MSKLLKVVSFSRVFPRSYGNKPTRRYNWFDEGIQYHGFKYYPRHPDFKDPPYEPSKLFRVERIKPLKGVPHNEKRLLQDLRITGKMHEPVVVKNIPENNARLWKIKHLIRIVPITFPDGFPNDVKHAYLKENGELKVVQTLDEKLKLAEDFKKEPARLDGDTLRRNSRNKWLTAYESVY